MKLASKSIPFKSVILMLEGLIHYKNENNVIKLPWNLGHILHERHALSQKTGSSVMNGTVRGKST